MGKYNTTPYDKLKLDLMYIQQQSIVLDIRILLLTIKTIFVPDSTEGVTADTAATDSHKLTPNSETKNKEEVSV